MAAPTRFPNGVTTNSANSPLRMMGQPDPTQFHTYFNDFDAYASGDWTVTVVGSGTQALTDEDGGVLLLTNSAADNDSISNSKVGEGFLLEIGKKTFFKTRLKLSDVMDSAFTIGLIITDTTPLDGTEGIFFKKENGDSNLDFRVKKGNDFTAVSNIDIVEDDTYIDMGFYYDGDSEIEYSTNGVVRGKTDTTNLPDDKLLTITFAIRNGEAAAKTMSIDYIMAVKER